MDKFLQDVKTNKKHGLLVSLESGVARRGNLQFELVDNRYVALYLTNNHYDMHAIEHAFTLIWSLDDTLRSLEKPDAPGLLYLTPDKIDAIQELVQAHQTTVSNIKKSLDATRKHVDELNVASINAIVLNQQPVAPSSRFQCLQCNYTTNTKFNLDRHVAKKHPR